MKRGIILICILLQSYGAFSQLNEISYFISGGVDDAELMLTEYIRPVANAMGANLSGGWYNTADVHKLGGFHLNVTASVAFAPKEHQKYDLENLELSSGIHFDNNIAKTAAGSTGSETQIWYSQDIPGLGEQEIVRYNHPGGSGYNMLPSPMLNAGVGLIKGTEILGRYMPKIKYGKDKSNSLGLWGLGVKHDLKQWIPFVKRVPVMNLSVMYAYTQANLHTSLNPLTPDMLDAEDLTTSVDWDNQSMDLVFQGHTANLLVGVTLPVVKFYGGAGFSITKTNLDLNGDYPMPSIITDAGSPDFGDVVVTDEDIISNPFNIEIKNQDGGTTKPRFNAGVCFKFTIITLHADYIWANYSVATVGLGISFR